MDDGESDGGALRLVEAQHGGVIGIEKGVAVEHEHGFFAGLREREANGASGAEGNAFDDIVEGHAVEGRAEVVLNDSVLVADGEQNARAAGAAQLGEQNFKKRAAGDGGHGLGQAVQARREPRAETAGENDGFHGDRSFER